MHDCAIVVLPRFPACVSAPLVAWRALRIGIVAANDLHGFALPDVGDALIMQIMLFLGLPNMIAAAEIAIAAHHECVQQLGAEDALACAVYAAFAKLAIECVLFVEANAVEAQKIAITHAVLQICCCGFFGIDKRDLECCRAILWLVGKNLLCVFIALVRVNAKGQKLALIEHGAILLADEMPICAKVNAQALVDGVLQKRGKLGVQAALAAPKGQNDCLRIVRRNLIDKALEKCTIHIAIALFDVVAWAHVACEVA